MGRAFVSLQAGATAGADGWLRVGNLCECTRVGHGSPVVAVVPPPPPIEGQVIDYAGRPLPYATLELVTAEGRQTAYTDTSGSLVFRLPSISTPDGTNRERVDHRTCYCPAVSFVHEPR